MSQTAGVCAIVAEGEGSSPAHVFGMGILVSRREILTCAHVVLSALGLKLSQDPRGQTVHVRFPFEGNQIAVNGYVDRQRYFSPLGGSGQLRDVAVIVLNQLAPRSVGRASLKPHRIDSLAKVYGFRVKETEDGRRLSHPTGEIADDVKIVGSLPGGLGQAEKLRTTGARVEQGFSGAAVYDSAQGAVVGMIVRSDSEEERRTYQFIDVLSIEKALGRRLLWLKQLVRLIRNNWRLKRLMLATAFSTLALFLLLYTVSQVRLPASLPPSYTSDPFSFASLTSNDWKRGGGWKNVPRSYTDVIGQEPGYLQTGAIVRSYHDIDEHFVVEFDDPGQQEAISWIPRIQAYPWLNRYYLITLDLPSAGSRPEEANRARISLDLVTGHTAKNIQTGGVNIDFLSLMKDCKQLLQISTRVTGVHPTKFHLEFAAISTPNSPHYAYCRTSTRPPYGDLFDISSQLTWGTVGFVAPANRSERISSFRLQSLSE